MVSGEKSEDTTQEGKMKFRKLAAYVFVAGMILFSAGTMEYTVISAAGLEDKGDVMENPWLNPYTGGEADTIPDLELEPRTTGNKRNPEKTSESLTQTGGGLQTTSRPEVVKVKKVTKKKSAKKVKITLKKKVKKANGYRIRFYAGKKDAKKNRKAIATVEYRKNRKTFTVQHRRLKNKKTLYVRVKAYLKADGKKYYSKNWSVAKKVSIKK